MISIMSLLVSIPLLAGMFGVLSDSPASPVFESVEVGVAELSPAGEAGGYAVPASASSNVTCTLTLTPNPSTQGQNVTLTWTNGLATMNVLRGGVTLGLQSNGWTDPGASGLAAGSYIYQIRRTSNNVTYSCSRTLTVNPAVQPDLTPSNIILNSGTLQVGSSATFAGTVTNSAAAGTGVGFDDRFLYRYGTSGTFNTINTIAKSALAAGASHGDTSSSLTLTTAGTLQIQLCADVPAGSGGVIVESNEANNCTTQSFTVAAAPVPTVDLTIRETGVGSWANSVNVDPGVNVELQWTSSGADRCIGDAYFTTGSGQPTSGTQGTVSEPSSGSRVYRVTCYDDDVGTNNTDTVTININPPSGDPSVTANPGRVQQGDPADIIWSTGGNANCVITGTNGDVFDLQALFPGQQSGTLTSGAINGETVYTISCDTGTPGSSTVRIFPVFEEI